MGDLYQDAHAVSGAAEMQFHGWLCPPAPDHGFLSSCLLRLTTCLALGLKLESSYPH